MKKRKKNWYLLKYMMTKAGKLEVNVLTLHFLYNLLSFCSFKVPLKMFDLKEMPNVFYKI